MTNDEILKHLPPTAPNMLLLWTAIVDVADRQDLGPSALGHRFLVPILGGRFYAGPGGQGLNGRVLLGGADRQLLRPDGVKELEAVYEMQAESGDILMIRNNVIVDETRQPDRYAMSVLSVSAPQGALAWLNRRLILGTLQTARPDRQSVVVRAWLADTH
jgi:hypothetical protein